LEKKWFFFFSEKGIENFVVRLTFWKFRDRVSGFEKAVLPMKTKIEEGRQTLKQKPWKNLRLRSITGRRSFYS